VEAHTLATAVSTGSGYLDHLILGVIAYCRGQLDEAVQKLRRGVAIELVSYKSGLFNTFHNIPRKCRRGPPLARAEEHYRTAIHPADRPPYRPAQPVARYWYAEMLLARGMESHRKRVRKLCCGCRREG
jgi:hypothetical protein